MIVTGNWATDVARLCYVVVFMGLDVGAPTSELNLDTGGHRSRRAAGVRP